MSNVPSYQAEIETPFVEFLRLQSVSDKTIANYRSDIKHFFDWITKQNIGDVTGAGNGSALLSAIMPEHLVLYRDSQNDQQVPVATINRRLSAIRTLFKWAADSGKVPANPALAIRNFGQEKPQAITSSQSLLGAFEQSLRNDGAAETTIRQYLSDVEGFLSFLSRNQTTEPTVHV